MDALTREQVLDELDHLAAVTHAQLVEFLFIACAMGNESQAPQGASSAAVQIADAVGEARSASIGQMRQLLRINEVLVLAGREPNLGRATELRGGPSPGIALAALTAAQLDGLFDRQLTIAQAIDRRYAALRPSVDPDGSPVFDEDLAGRISLVIDIGVEHATRVTRVRDALAGLSPSMYFTVTRDAAHADSDVERSLLDLSDRWYDFIVVTLQLGFGNEQLRNAMLNRAGTAMFSMDAVDSLLAARKLLPAFTPSSGL